MPHIKLQTTSDVVENQDLVEILERLVAKLASFETVSSHAIKAYHNLQHTWLMGHGAPNGFVHCEVAILSGRPQELRTAIADGMHAELLECFAASRDSGEAGITLEIREMDGSTYRK